MGNTVTDTAASTGDVQLYESADGSVQLRVRTDGETVWLTRQQMAALFGRDVKTIGKHIVNALREELAGIPVVAKFATTAADGKTYQVEHYNLDMVLSIGYRVKSSEGVRFRQWANDVLRRYLIAGAALNEQRLQELGKVARILSRAAEPELAGVADVLAAYLPGLHLLREYDEGSFPETAGAVPNWTLTLDEARRIIAGLGRRFPDDTLLGQERGDALAGIVAAIYQGFGGQDVYPTVEQKAANLLYLTVKDHPLSDGNKRTAAALFVTFLDRNGLLADAGGHPVVTNNALAAITLLVATSAPREKDLMVALIVRMLAEHGR